MAIRREFLINIIFLIGINLLIKPFYIFGIDRTVQNTVGAEEYGIYFALFNFTMLWQIINDFGIQNFNNRNIAQHRHLLDKYFPNILTLKMVLAVMYLAVITVSAYIAEYEYRFFHLLFVLAINQILISLIFFLRSNLSALGLYRTDSLISTLDKLLMIMICGALLWIMPFRANFTVEWFAYAQTMALVITALIAGSVVYKRLVRWSWQFRPGFLLFILRESYPFALVVFLMTAYTRIDGVMIERLLPDGKLEVGIYASAYRLLDAGNMIGFLFAGLLLPMFSRMLKNREAIQPLLRMSFKLIWIIVVTLTVASYFYRQPIIELLYVEADTYWAEVFGYLIISYIAVGTGYIFGTLLTANGSLKSMNIIFVAGVAINVLLNYFLILEYKALGAAIATDITQYGVVIAQVFLAKRLLNLRFDINLFFRAVLFAVFCLAAGYYLSNYIVLDWRLSMLIFFFISLILVILFRLLDLNTLKQLKWISPE